jgi:hypothetical protein
VVPRLEVAAGDDVLSACHRGHKVEELVDLVGEAIGASLVLMVDEMELEDGKSGSAMGGTDGERSGAYDGSHSALSGSQIGLV